METSRYATTEYNRKTRLLARARDILERTRHYRLSLAGYLELRTELQTSPDWKRAPATTREYVHGWMDAGLQSMEREHAFVYVTERGPVRMSYDAERAPMLPALSDDECRNVDARNYPRGTVWIPAAAGLPLRWWHGPTDDDGKVVQP